MARKVKKTKFNPDRKPRDVSGVRQGSNIIRGDQSKKKSNRVKKIKDTKSGKEYTGKEVGDQFIGVRTVTEREQKLRESEKAGFYSIREEPEKTKAEVIAEQTAKRQAIPVTTTYIPLDQEIQVQEEEPEKDRPNQQELRENYGLGAGGEVREFTYDDLNEQRFTVSLFGKKLIDIKEPRIPKVREAGYELRKKAGTYEQEYQRSGGDIPLLDKNFLKSTAF